MISVIYGKHINNLEFLSEFHPPYLILNCTFDSLSRLYLPRTRVFRNCVFNSRFEEIKESNFSYSLFSKVTLGELDGVNFSGAELYKVNFSGGLKRLDFSRARLIGVVIPVSAIRGPICFDGTKFIDSKIEGVEPRVEYFDSIESVYSSNKYHGGVLLDPSQAKSLGLEKKLCLIYL